MEKSIHTNRVVINEAKNISLWTISFLMFLLLVLSGCNSSSSKSMELSANEASKVYCDCVKENIFKFRYAEDLYVFWNKEVSARFRLFKPEMELEEVKNTSTIDSMKLFKKYFFISSDSCSCLPVKKYPTQH